MRLTTRFSNFILLAMGLLSLLACESKDPVQSQDHSTPVSEQVQPPSQSDIDLIVSRAENLLSPDKATKLYLTACNSKLERTPTQCDCIVSHLREHLPDIMFDLQAAAEAGESDIAHVLINTMDDLKIDFRKKMGLTQGDALDKCWGDPNLK